MKPIPTAETNKLMGAGDNPNTSDLPMTIALCPEMTDGQNIPQMVTCWELSAEEIAQLASTGKLWISIMGVSMPPICPMAYHPFKEGGFTPLDLER